MRSHNLFSRLSAAFIVSVIVGLSFGLNSCESPEPEAVLVQSISVSQPSIAVTEGETATIVITVKPDNASNKTVTFVSSNTAVVTVSESGAVTAVGPGTATITITSADGPKTTLQVTVQAKTVAVTGITLSDKEISLVEGESFVLTAAVAPDNATDKTFTLSSNNSAVATVDASGKVSAIAAGTATITATTNDGAKTASCKVTVVQGGLLSSDYISYASFYTDNSSDNPHIVKVGSDIELKIFKSDGSTYTSVDIASITWSSSNADVATVTESGPTTTLTVLSAGDATITATSADGSSKSYYISAY